MGLIEYWAMVSIRFMDMVVQFDKVVGISKCLLNSKWGNVVR